MEKDSRMFHQMAQQAVSEVGSVLAQVQTAAVDVMCAEILKARHIACYGVGREGLMMKAFCMRLMHLGLDAHAVGEMTAPPLFAGDLLIASAGPGSFSTVMALLEAARDAGARTMVVTAQPSGPASRIADLTMELPAQTMANDLTESASLLPMGSLYEAAPPPKLGATSHPR